MDCLVSDIYHGPLGIYSYYFFKKTPERYTLLPNCHAAYYPLSFHPSTGEVLEGTVNFFNEHFIKHAANPAGLRAQDLEYKQYGKPNKRQAIVLNLLDNCFGHSVIKLLNTSVVFDRFHGQYDLVCIAPKPLAYLLPKQHF